MSSFDLSFNEIIGWIGFITTIIIVLVVSIRSVFDVFKSTGIFYKGWMNIIYQNEDEKIKRTLEQLGLLNRANHYKNLTKALDSGIIFLNTEDSRKELKILSKKFIEKESLIVGDTTEEHIDYYLNLRKAFLTGEAQIMIQLMCSLIRKKSLENCMKYDCIISRKGALDLLGYYVAERFELPFVLYHEQKSILNLKNHEVRPFDYIPQGVKYPIIVDDSCVGGTSIASLAIAYKKITHIKIENAFVLFTRKLESKEKLKKAGVELHYLEYYNDEKLKEL